MHADQVHTNLYKNPMAEIGEVKDEGTQNVYITDRHRLVFYYTLQIHLRQGFWGFTRCKVQFHTKWLCFSSNNMIRGLYLLSLVEWILGFIYDDIVKGFILLLSTALVATANWYKKFA